MSTPDVAKTRREVNGHLKALGTVAKCMSHVCRGYVRNLGLSANQVLHIPGAGDFQIKQIQVLEKPQPLGLTHKGQASGKAASAMEVSASQHFILPDPEQQEQLVRENEADDLVGEQTWPTDKARLAAHLQQTQLYLTQSW